MKLFNQNRNYRIKLIPFWFRVLIAIQLFIAVIVSYFFLLGKVAPDFRIRCFGFQSFGLNSPLSYVLILFLILNYVSCVYILSGKTNALKIAKTTYLIAIATSSISIFLMLCYPNDPALYFPIESAIFVGLYYYASKMEYRWQLSFSKN